MEMLNRERKECSVEGQGCASPSKTAPVRGWEIGRMATTKQPRCLAGGRGKTTSTRPPLSFQFLFDNRAKTRDFMV